MPLNAFQETEFWSRQFSEHLTFLGMLFTDEALAAEAKNLQRHYDRARRVALSDPLHAAAKLQSMNEIVFKFQNHALQRLKAGDQLGSAFPLFVEHITREMELYDHLVHGAPAPLGSVDATVKLLGLEHALFAAHLLDPSQAALVAGANAAADSMEPLVGDPARNVEAADVERAIAAFVIDNRLGEKGGALSIIPEQLAKHVVREQYYFANKLERI